MSPIHGARFLRQAAEWSCNYEKTSAPQKPMVVHRLFVGSERKPIARHRAVGPSRRAGRLRGGRVHQANKQMHDLRRRTTTDAPSDKLFCRPGCPGGVPAGPPFSRDTFFDGVSRWNAGIHSKKSKVSRVSRVILKTIASAGVCARSPTRRRPKGSIPKQPGHPGHLSNLTMLSEGRRPLPAVWSVPAETVLNGTPQDTRDTPARWCA